MKTESATNEYENPGYIKVQLSLLMILATSSVLSLTGLQIFRLGSNTSEGSTSYKIENLEVADANGRVKVTGKHTTEVLTNLQKLKTSGEQLFQKRNNKSP